MRVLWRALSREAAAKRSRLVAAALLPPETHSGSGGSHEATDGAGGADGEDVDMDSCEDIYPNVTFVLRGGVQLTLQPQEFMVEVLASTSFCPTSYHDMHMCP